MVWNTKLIDGKPSSKHPLYRTWKGMRERCRYEKHKDYAIYGGRGIKVCDRWLNFENFVADVGEKPLGYTLDRVDYNGDYEPNNFRWASPSEQSKNQRKRKTGFKKGAYSNNQTGVVGVYKMDNGRFRAMIFINGKNKHLGCFETVEDAAKAVEVVSL